MYPASYTQSSIRLFYSYSHKDEDMRDELEKHLSILKRRGLITGWNDRRIGAGKEWEKEVSAHLENAQIILLLISADFIASDYCYSIEMKKALQRHEIGEARVVPIILRPVDWAEAPFSKLQILPTDARPVTLWEDTDEAFSIIVRGIREAIREITNHQERFAGIWSSYKSELSAKSDLKNLGPEEDKQNCVTTKPAVDFSHWRSSFDTWRRSAQPPNSLLPYLLDRSDQEKDLRDALVAHREQKPQRPLICVIHGDELECHTLFLRRLQEKTLRGLLSHWYPKEAGQFPIVNYDLQMPLKKITASNYEDILWDNLRTATHGGKPVSREEIINFIAQHKLAVMFNSSILTEDLHNISLESLEMIFKFWSLWPNLPEGLLLFICMSYKYQKERSIGWSNFITRWRHRKRNKDISSYVNGLDFSDYKNIYGVRLTELKAISRSDAEALINLDVVRNFYDFHDRDIRSLYGKLELCTSEGCIPMEMLLENLMRIHEEKIRHLNLEGEG
jgi:hypothetical protein